MNSIGNFFIKIGRGIKKAFFGLINWVKNTAWIQPLLIVGLIFGVILCIKPAVNWIGGLFNPETQIRFYKDLTVKSMDNLYEENIKTVDGTVIVIFYGDNDSSSKSIESDVQNYAATSKGQAMTWICIDTDTDEKDENKVEESQDAINDAFQNNFFDEYSAKYDSMPDKMKSSDHTELTISDADTTNVKIPTPMFARYDKGELIGIRLGLTSSTAYTDLELFAEGTMDQWEKGKLN